MSSGGISTVSSPQPEQPPKNEARTENEGEKVSGQVASQTMSLPLLHGIGVGMNFKVGVLHLQLCEAREPLGVS